MAAQLKPGHRNGPKSSRRGSTTRKPLAMDSQHLDALLGATRMEDREGRLDVAQMLYRARRQGRIRRVRPLRTTLAAAPMLAAATCRRRRGFLTQCDSH